MTADSALPSTRTSPEGLELGSHPATALLDKQLERIKKHTAVTTESLSIRQVLKLKG
eukprot:CAMPEP_0179139188 /NCGR_PEP_ID=MMETSP0796-20121207/66546_1 /TAXON_ID=73915 /ORGANISM="Pyrodinium bahamense, Strain pbaha01" /LENGTH=56 /DNA_ID=CAMNT_0020838581 /DNA_START=76 /DNA_END=242 /DNA_ORIENTATION=+